jgi:hypothetical protein
MKKIRALTLLALFAALALMGSGCSTQTSMGKKETVLLGGLYERREGAYEKQSLNTFPVNNDRPSPTSRLTGKKTSVLWGLFSYTDQ